MFYCFEEMLKFARSVLKSRRFRSKYRWNFDRLQNGNFETSQRLLTKSRVSGGKVSNDLIVFCFLVWKLSSRSLKFVLPWNAVKCANKLSQFRLWSWNLSYQLFLFQVKIWFFEAMFKVSSGPVRQLGIFNVCGEHR